MRNIILILTGLASILLIPSSANAADELDELNDQPYFSLFGPGPLASNQAATAGQQLTPPPNPTVLPRSVVHPPPMTGKEKWHHYLKTTYGPQAIAWSLVGAGIKQAQDSVPEWGQGMEGYGKRFASAYGQKVIKRSVQHGLGAWFGEDPRYFASESSGIWPRTLHAVKEITVMHKDSGGTRIAYSRFAGIAAGVVISRQWRPADDRGVEEYLSATAISLGLDAGRNVLKEFWPDIKQRIPFFK